MPIDVNSLNALRPRKVGPGMIRDLVMGCLAFTIGAGAMLVAGAATAAAAVIVFVKILRWGGVM